MINVILVPLNEINPEYQTSQSNVIVNQRV